MCVQLKIQNIKQMYKSRLGNLGKKVRYVKAEVIR